jgi:hypothetical protein
MTWNTSRFWEELEPGQGTQVGVSLAAIADWEAKHKLPFPASLKAVYAVQNGGLIRYGDVVLLPLDQITWPKPEIWELFTNSNIPFEDPSSVLMLSAEEDSETFHVMDFSKAGPDDMGGPDGVGGPVVIGCHCYTDVVVDEEISLDEFLRNENQADEAPLFAWSETQRLDEVLHREEITIKTGDGADDSVFKQVQILGRRDGKLFFYEHYDDQRMARHQIDEPLESLDARIEQILPKPHRRYSLQIGPADPGGIHVLECNRMADGMWKNDESDNQQTWVEIESPSFATLKALRVTLLGAVEARRAVRSQQRELLWAILTAGTLFVFCFPFLLILVLLTFLFRILGYPIRRLRNMRTPAGPHGNGGDGEGPIVRVKAE